MRVYSTREIEILPQSDRAHTASYFLFGGLLALVLVFVATHDSY